MTMPARAVTIAKRARVAKAQGVAAAPQVAAAAEVLEETAAGAEAVARLVGRTDAAGPAHTNTV